MYLTCHNFPCKSEIQFPMVLFFTWSWLIILRKQGEKQWLQIFDFSGFVSLPSPPYYPSIPHLFLYWNRWFHTSVVTCKWQLFLLIFITVLNYSISVFSYQTQQQKSWKLPDTLSQIIIKWQPGLLFHFRPVFYII